MNTLLGALSFSGRCILRFFWVGISKFQLKIYGFGRIFDGDDLADKPRRPYAGVSIEMQI
jgi:hypothetical protein